MLALVEARFPAGTHELYQLPLGFRPADDGWDEGVIAKVDGGPSTTRSPTRRTRARSWSSCAGATVEAGEGRLAFRWAERRRSGGRHGDVRPVGVEQSNTSVVFGDELILKVYRRLEPGVNPELEMLRFLTERGFPNIPPLAGWYAYDGRLLDATLGILQEFVAGAPRRLGARAGRARRGARGVPRPRCAALGEVTGGCTRRSPPTPADPAFAPRSRARRRSRCSPRRSTRRSSASSVDLPDDPRRSRRSRAAARRSASGCRCSRTSARAGGVIRHHGDYHLGQTLLADRRLGDPRLRGRAGALAARAAPQALAAARRRRDAALVRVRRLGARELLRGVDGARGLGGARARRRSWTGYFERVDPALLPPGQEAIEKLLSVFELEKAVYELRYELNNRPDWVPIPVAGHRCGCSRRRPPS